MLQEWELYYLQLNPYVHIPPRGFFYDHCSPLYCY